MMQESQRESSRKPVIPRHRRHLQEVPLQGSIALNRITGRGRGGEGVELLQQGFHLTFHGCGGG